MHRMRNFVGRQTSLAMRQDRLDFDILPRSRYHEQRRNFAEMLVRHPNYGAIEHWREGVHHLLDFGRCDVLAATDDEFLQPPGNSEKAVFVALREIAGVIPARTQCSARFLRL